MCVSYMAIIITILIYACPVHAFDDWDGVDYALLGAMTAAQVIDWRQTRQIAEQPERFHEVNPLIGRHPNISRVDLYFVASFAVKLGVAHVLPSEWRKVWLGTMAVGSMCLVIHNDSVGIGARW